MKNTFENHPLEEKDNLIFKRATNYIYKRFGVSIFFFLLFAAAAFYLHQHPQLIPPQKGMEGFGKIPFYIFCFISLMMLISIARGLWRLYMIILDKEEGEKLCGKAVYKRIFGINKVPYLLLECDKNRKVPISAPWPGPQIKFGEEVYVEVAPRSSVFFVIRHKDKNIEINIEKRPLYR